MKEYKTLEDLHSALTQVKQNIESLGCFENENFKFEIIEDQNKCVIDLVETSKLRLTTKVTSDQKENLGGEMSLDLNNYFGGAETFTAVYSKDFKNGVNSATFNKPIFSDWPAKAFKLGISTSGINNLDHASYTQDDISIWTTLESINHNFSFENIYRNIKNKNNSTEKILLESGPFIKSALNYRWIYDNRDNFLVPTQGYRGTVLLELAGLLGDVKHVKFESKFNHNLSLNSKMVLHLNHRIGVLLGLYQPTRISDRFNFQQGNIFHGFEQNSIGPRIANDNLGGDIYWTSSVHATHLLVNDDEFPFKIYAHAFGQIGNNISSNDKKSLFSFTDSINPIRSTIGASLAATFLNFRVDLTYSFPLSVGANDKPKNFSVDFTSNFL